MNGVVVIAKFDPFLKMFNGKFHTDSSIIHLDG